MITDLIPQRDPILMVDDAKVVSEGIVETFLVVRSNNWFCKDGLFLEAGMVEHMAQSAAAMVGLSGEGEPHIGYIGDVKDFKEFRLPAVGETITTSISIVMQMENITLIEAISKVEGTIVAKARVKVFIVE